MLRFHRKTVCTIAILASGCSSGAPTDPDSVGASTDALFGCVSESRVAPFVQASAKVNIFVSPTENYSCSGTLVSPNQVMSAAHCFCTSSGNFANQGTVQFADSNGIVGNNATGWPIVNVEIPDGQYPCGGGDWADFSKDDHSYHTPRDLAFITIGPDSLGTLPPFTPARMYLGDPALAFQSRQLVREVWAVGYGNNAPSPWVNGSETCFGCNVRRSGAVGDVVYGNDPCAYIDQIPVEQDCYDEYIFSAKSISDGNWSEASTGDSGGGLFFNVDKGCVEPTETTTAPGVLAGVSSAWIEASDTRSRWASFRYYPYWICSRLNLPPARTVNEARAGGDAIYSRGNVNLNDRTRVVKDSAGTIGATVTGGPVTLGVESIVGDVRANGDLWLRDRARVLGSAQSTTNIQTQNQTSIAGLSTDGLCTKLEPVSLVVPFSAGLLDREIQNIRGPAVADYALTPTESVRDLVVRARVRLTLAPGLYVFRELRLEPGAFLVVPDDTWIFVLGNTAVVHGDVIGNASKIFFGVPNGGVNIGGEWRGTLVAQGSVDADMHTGARLEGTFFVDRNFTLHQGRWLKAVPFTGNWIPTCDANRTNCH